MARFKDQAVCIRLLDWSESSQVVTLMTHGHGKVRGLAKGARRMSPGSVARFSGGFELLTAGQIVATTKAASDLATLTEWDLQRPHHHFRMDLQAQRLGLYAADVVNALMADHDAHPATHDALLRVLADLASAKDAWAALLRFQWALLADAGYRLALVDAPDARGQYVFSPHTGQFALAAGRAEAAHGWLVRGSTLAALGDVAAEAAGGQAASLADDAVTLRANRLLCVYLRALLDRELPTMPFVLGT